MPIYEYECRTCKKKFEYLVRSKDEAIQCPECAGSEVSRLLSTFAFTSKDKGGNITASSGGCSGCSGGNCSTCGH
ncbi:MAG: zinc ribbon domain-containing protein [Candidatus Omnitrophica bacterium]|nr:zinc ribbon domain-containing protein [Candidatus Omnitrophota bacterium]